MDHDIDYVERDYEGFRKRLLEHISLRVPGWKEENPSDIGHVIVELLAHAADELSYYQDAVATESYLGTARLRSSVRAHARLLDYRMHEGCNARVWVIVELEPGRRGPAYLEAGTQVHTGTGTGVAGRVARQRVDLGEEAQRLAASESCVTFETMERIKLEPCLAKLEAFGARGGSGALARGSTEAVLAVPCAKTVVKALRRQSVLILERGSETGRGLAHPVRVRRVEYCSPPDLEGRRLEAGVECVRVEWDPADALPFELGAVGESERERVWARGNVVLADQGRTVEWEALDPVRPAVRYRPKLRELGVVLSEGLGGGASGRRPSARESVRQDPHRARAAVQLRRKTEGGVEGREVERWALRRDLLDCGPLDPCFLVDLDREGRGTLRMGFGGRGRRPVVGDCFEARYRVGYGSEGNVGARALTRIACATKAVVGAWNPLPACGGVDPESLYRVKERAPQALQEMRVCVSEEDHARHAEEHPSVAEAVARTVRAGSRETTVIVVRRRDGQPVDSEYREMLLEFLEPMRLIGRLLTVEGPQAVALRVALHLVLEPGAHASTVERRLRTALFGKVRGAPGLFHAGVLGLGQAVYASQVVDLALGVSGVRSVAVAEFRRLAGSETQQRVEVGVGDVATLSPKDLVLDVREALS